MDFESLAFRFYYYFLRFPYPTGSLLAFLENFSYLNGKRINNIVLAELAGTRDSLTKQMRPNYTITFPHLIPQAVGEFLLFHEIVVGLLGVMLDVNPFDQPAVEESKELTRKMLRKPRD